VKYGEVTAGLDLSGSKFLGRMRGSKTLLII